ncbi:MAG: fructose-1,6-bisphosphatase [Pygmaiobacter sp.]
MGDYTNEQAINEERQRYLELLARDYPNRSAASAAIINLEAVLKLPKGTEHFMSDLHGEHEAFTHILNNASGVIKEKVDLVLGKTVSEKERARFATLIYYPVQKLEELKELGIVTRDWYRVTLYRLIDVCRLVASKNTRKFVRESLPKNFEYIIDELLHAHFEDHSKELYYEQIVTAIIEVEHADEFICALSELIKKLAVYKLHIVGDIFDRGSRPDIIIDKLMVHHSVDLQWGNHDVLWMGAASGSLVNIACAVNITLSYNNVELIEEGYGITLRPLSLFAEQVYSDVDCSRFAPSEEENNRTSTLDDLRIARMHKAIAVMMLKLEAAAIRRNPDFAMEHRTLLEAIDFAHGTVKVDGKTYVLQDTALPTVDPKDPTALTAGEQDVLAKLRRSFMQSEKLARQVRFLYAAGSVYRTENGNLLFHGAIPLTAEGGFDTVMLDGTPYCGKALMDYCETRARDGYFEPEGSDKRLRGQDFLWYLWCGPKSPIYGRDKMSTFEHLFLDDRETWSEQKNAYYDYTDSVPVAQHILAEFGLDPETSHIINGHVPVLARTGESPIKAGGRLIVIDGGFCKAYHPKTGIAGYTLVYSSRGLSLRSHEPFESVQKAISENRDILSTVAIFETNQNRTLIADTDEGKIYRRQIDDLKRLLAAYRAGSIKEGSI